jgi:hypothetical protein
MPFASPTYPVIVFGSSGGSTSTLKNLLRYLHIAFVEDANGPSTTTLLTSARLSNAEYPAMVVKGKMVGTYPAVLSSQR